MGETSIRERLYWRIDRLMGMQEGQERPWYMILIHFILMPLKTIDYLLDEKYNKYDFMRGVYKINRLSYPYRFFEFLEKEVEENNDCQLLIWVNDSSTIQYKKINNIKELQND